VILRIYELVALERAPMLAAGLLDLIWSSIPFVFALGFAALTRHTGPASGFASASLLAGFYAHYVLYHAPSPGYGSSLIIFLPLWCMLIIGPLGAIVGWFLWRGEPAVSGRRPK